MKGDLSSRGLNRRRIIQKKMKNDQEEKNRNEKTINWQRSKRSQDQRKEAKGRREKDCNW